MYQVRKRDGKICDFDITKVTTAITKAFESQNKQYVPQIIDLLSLQVTSNFSTKVKDNVVSIEDIQDSVEYILQQSGYGDIAKAYILYRKQREKIRNIKSTVLDYKELVNSYIKLEDWRVKENSTVTYSLGGLILNNSGAITANYWLNELYDEEIANAHKNCDIHIHDLSMLSGYCAGWSLKQLITEGLGGVPGKITSSPASHLSTLCNQMVNFLGIMQNEWAGAQAFSSFDTYLAPFVKVDNLSYKQVKQCIQSFIYGVNTPSRWGCVPENYKVATTEGWKGIDDLKKGDILFTWKDGKLSTCKNNEVVIKNHCGELISLKNDHYGYKQTVTPYHRVLYCPTNGHLEDCKILQAEQLIEKDTNITNYTLPTAFNGISCNESGVDLTDDEIKLAAMIYTDGSFNYRNGILHKIKYYKSNKRLEQFDAEQVFVNCGLSLNRLQYTSNFTEKMNSWSFYGDDARKIEKIVGQKDRIDNKFFKMNQRQAELFLNIWQIHDGEEEKKRTQVDNEDIYNAIAIINLLAGRTINKYNRKLKSGKTTTYCKAIQVNKCHFDVEKVDYDGRVWCPSCDDGTAIFMNDNGGVFISGQCQAPFTNITLDWTVPNDLAELNALVGGKEMNFKYKDCKKEMDMINKAFIEIMIEGDANGRGFQYPIPTYSITRDFDWSETENNQLLFEMTSKYGTPYFSNYVNSDMEPSDVRSMCCRLRLDLRELRRKSGGFFGSGESTGSVGVVTINMPHIAYLSADKEDFYKRLDKIMDISARSLKIKRDVITHYLNEGLYPYTKRYLGTFANHFSTIGLIGMNEACLNAGWIKKDLSDPDSLEFTKEVLNHMRNRLSDYQEKYGDLYNLEATPAESTSYRLAKHDKAQYPNIITASENNNVPYYTNSSHLPVNYTADMFSALEIQDELQILYTSGTVFHAFLGEKLPSWQSTAKLVRTVAENYKLPYYTISPTYSVCSEHGYISGEHFECPICGKKTEVYSRITGYYRPVQNWNDGKTQEYKQRVEYVVDPVKAPRHALETNHCDETGCNLKTEETNLLFATKTCPNCKMAKMMLDKANIKYTIVDAEDEKDKTLLYGVHKAPTLLIPSGDTFIKIENASNIKAYIENNK